MAVAILYKDQTRINVKQTVVGRVID